MDIKRLITHFTYHIEAKPEGGFIARASEPNLPPLEAPTRWELQQKIQQNISAAMAAEFPGLKLPIESRQLKMSFHVEQNPGGGFTIHSSDPNSRPTDAASHDLESKFTEKLISMMGRHLISHLPPELAAQLSSGDIKVFETRQGMPVGDPINALSDGKEVPMSNADPNLQSMAGSGTINAGENAAGRIGYYSGDSPIKPATSSSVWPMIRFLIALLIMAAIMYFFVHHR
jgi:hypothetical protein